ncbi:MAG: endonuclease/exonuclease/phosphatase family protein [Bacteroidales bacterium]
MKSFISVIIVFIMFAVSCSNPQHELSIMTFNIRYDNPADGQNQWQNRVPLVRAYLDSVAPDIAGMQEVVHHQLIDLQDMLPGYSYIGTGRDDGKTKGEYSPLFFKEDRFILRDNSQFWLSETPSIPGSKSWDAAITRIVSWAALEDIQSGETIYVFNTHFDHRGEESRRKSAELISEKITEIAGESPVVLMGDFNIRKGSGDYEFMTRIFNRNNGLRNTESVAETPVEDAESTINGFSHDMEPRVIDFIFTDGNFSVPSYRVDEVIENGIFLSDHWPVVAELRY